MVRDETLTLSRDLRPSKGESAKRGLIVIATSVGVIYDSRSFWPRYGRRQFRDDKEFDMARRRKSSKSRDAAGLMLLIFLGLAAYVYEFVAAHYVEIGLVAMGIGAVWLMARLVRSKSSPVGASPAIPAAAQVAKDSRLAHDALPVSSNSEKAPDPFVRITPIVDPPASGAAPARLWFHGRGSEPKVGNASWVRAGEPVNVQGVEISSGWFYLGTEMRSDYSRTEGCLINPKLRIAKSDEKSPEGEAYVSSYSDFTPVQRRAFLEWMAAGRRSPDVLDNIIRIFIDGLEYRVFKQGVRTELQELVEEAERILDLYGTSAEFSWNAIRFVSYAGALLSNPKRPNPRFAKVVKYGGFEELSPQLRVFIGNKIAKGERLTAEDALVWAMGVPNVWLRTPATRCKEEFEALWSMRFNAQHPDGFAVKPPKARISLSYPTGYGVAPEPLRGDFEKLPDIASDEQTAAKLRDIVEACTNELDAYSRFLGRHSELTGTPRASLLLPEDLWIRRYESSAGSMAAVLGDNEILVIGFDELMTAAEFPFDDASSKERAAALDKFSSVLRRFNVGIEPSGSHSEAVLSAETAVSLFKLAGQTDGSAENDQSSWRAAVDVAILGVATAGPVTDAARGAAATSIATDFPDFDPMRIGAYAAAAAAAPVGNRLTKLLKAAGNLPVVERQSMARCAVSAALSGGGVPPSTVKFLERLYGALSFTSSDLYAAIHRGDAERPVTTTAATPSEAGLDAVGLALEGGGAALPAQAGKVVIDVEKLARARASTHAVSKILADVFADDHQAARGQAVDDVEKRAGATKGSTIPGLDAAHATLLSIVMDSGSLERKAFESRAKELRLLADGAIEHINDWAFDRFDEPLIEDGDAVTLVSHLRDRVGEMRGKEQ
jgi:hypothetical protein